MIDLESATRVIDCLTPHGQRALYAVRPSTNDAALVGGIVGDDEYDLANITVSGWALDIGAHIGTVSIALAIDNPDLRVVAVEALSDNVAVLRESIEANGLRERVLVEHAAADEGSEPVSITYGWSRADNQPDDYMRDSRFIGGMVEANDTSTVEVCSPLSLGAILDRYEIAEVALLKIDCEGCEWQFLRSPRVKDIDLIIGEYHNAGGLATLQDLLPDHEVTQAGGLPDIGLFRAVRR